ncbi:MAG: amidohydrolase [Desulfobacteraceae bacterium]|nr:MAG: amidohydrolase [Desulfobacteraceae bacterium]
MKHNPFLQEAGSLLNQMREIRRDLHKHPELGMQEIRTSRIVADYLKNLGLDVRTEVGGYGVLALLSTRAGGNTVALRADMDALPLEEKNKVPYASVKRGVAHCCGHDGHTAILLGAANLLCKFSDKLNGNVKFIFQPSEDKSPGGAIPMIADGALRDPDVDGIFSLHLSPELAEGTAGIKSGFSTISSAEFILKMIGKGCHVASPHESVDPVIMAGMVIMAGQTIVSRRINPLDPTIISFCTVQGGTASNIIPEEVTLTGTIRTLKPEKREELANHLDQVAQGVARSSGGTCHLTLKMEYPSVFNHPELTAEFKDSAAKIVPADSVIEMQSPSMTGEDVAYFHQKVPGVHWLLGSANPAMDFTHPLHSPVFDFNEEIMPLGAAIHACCAVDFLRNRQKRPLSSDFGH